MQHTLKVGEWTVHTDLGELVRGNEVVRLDARTVRFLLYLIERAGEVVSVDALLSEVWQGVVVTQDSVYQAVTELRRILGDDARKPTYIATIPRRGYRLIAQVKKIPDSAELPVKVLAHHAIAITPSSAYASRVKWAFMGVLSALAVSGLMMIAILRSGGVEHAIAAPSLAASQSVAVMPFLDLTDEMTEEPFADGMVEEVVGKLSKFPALKVAPPTSSFFYKGKKVVLADVAHALKVHYVLDGSVRKSAATLRVAVRLTRTDDGFIVWSETYDRAWSDKLMIQNDIAEQVAKALTATLH